MLWKGHGREMETVHSGGLCGRPTALPPSVFTSSLIATQQWDRALWNVPCKLVAAQQVIQPGENSRLLPPDAGPTGPYCRTKLGAAAWVLGAILSTSIYGTCYMVT